MPQHPDSRPPFTYDAEGNLQERQRPQRPLTYDAEGNLQDSRPPFTYDAEGNLQERQRPQQPSRMGLLLEAERRGMELDPQDQALLTEARRRGMLEGGAAAEDGEERGLGEAALRAATIGAGGFNRGVTNIASTIVDPITASATRGLSLIPGVEMDDARPIQALQGTLQQAGVFGPEPEGTGERFLSRAFEEAGAAAVPQAALTRTASLGPQAMQQGMRMFSRPGVSEARTLPQRAQQTLQRLPENAARFLQEPFRQAPVRTNVMESLTALGAGSGAQMAREMGAEPYGTGEMLGALGGGMTVGGAIGTGSTIGRGLGRIFGGRSTASPTVQREVGEALRDVMTDPAQAGLNITRNANMGERIPGFEPTLAQMTEDPGIASIEAARGSTGRRAGEFARRRREQNQAFEQAVDEHSPGGDPTATQQELTRRRQGALDTAEGQTVTRQQARDEAVAGAQPEQTPQQAGSTIRDARTEELAAAREQESRLWQQIEPEKIDVDVNPIRERAQAILRDTPRAQQETMPDLVRRVAEGDESLLQEGDTLDELLGFRSRLRAEIDAERSGPSPDANRVRQLNQLSEEVEDTIQGTGERLSDPTAAERFQEATQFSRELNERFTRGPVGRIGQTQGRGGTPKVADSDVAREFFSGRRAGPERVRAFRNAFESRPEAVQALRDAALEDAGMRNIVREDGKVNTARLERWVDNNDDLLKAYPEIEQDLGNVSRAERFFRRARKREEMLQKGLDNPRESTIARFLSPEDARDGMQQILRSPRPGEEADNLMRLVRRDEDAKYGARQAFFDLMMEGPSRTTGRGVRAPAEGFSADETVLRYTRLRDFLNENQRVARELFKDNPEHLDRLRQLSEDMQRAQAIQHRGATPSLKPDNKGSVPGMTFQGMISRSYGIAREVVSPVYVAAETGSRVIRRRVIFYRRNQVEQLLDDALLNPELAKTLVLKASDNNRNVLRRRLRLHLTNHIGAEDQETTEDQIPEDAIYIGPDGYRAPEAILEPERQDQQSDETEQLLQ